MAPRIRFRDKSCSNILMEYGFRSVIYAERRIRITLPGIRCPSNPIQVFGQAALQIQFCAQKTLMVGIEGDSFRSIGIFTEVQIGMVRRDGAIEAVEAVKGIVHIGKAGSDALAGNQEFGIVVEGHLFGPAGVDVHIGHELVPIVRVDGTVAIVIDLSQDSGRKTEVVVVVKRRHHAKAPA